MSEGLKIAFELLGGLALFIYSMNMMSQGLPNASVKPLNLFMGI